MPIVLVVALLVGAGVLRSQRAASAAADRSVGQITATERAATFTFDPAISEADRAAFLRAVADARRVSLSATLKF